MHRVEITEVNPPWREGRAIVVSYRTWNALVFGWWTPPETKEPTWLSSLDYMPDEIGDWNDGR